ncbi:MAG: ABC transporter ATP-binding protein [Myxococcota bacterium]|jgi:lipoprotein-releasing system ATP-binding protein|nr:ABC transporter ATP-binding protein [Myxococcota bacterium]
MDEPILKAQSLVKEYGGSTGARVLRGVDVSLRRGELAALIGPSGSGKSTLLNILGLLDRQTSGRLQVDGVSTSELDDDELTALRGNAIGFVFQFHHLLSAFTVLENVYMPHYVAVGHVDDAMMARARELLSRVGLADLQRRKASDLSGGQQQRVAIARAFMARPAVVLADEPTGNLDTETADEVFDVFRALNTEEGTALLVVTHDPRLADRCDRIVRIVDGLIVSDETGRSQGPCRACGYGPCLAESCLRSADIPRPLLRP